MTWTSYTGLFDADAAGRAAVDEESREVEMISTNRRSGTVLDGAADVVLDDRRVAVIVVAAARALAIHLRPGSTVSEPTAQSSRTLVRVAAMASASPMEAQRGVGVLSACR